jgi:AraC-like DNA-binding protein
VYAARTLSFWRAVEHPKHEAREHSVSRGFGHALFAPLRSNLFEHLRVAATVWKHTHLWFPIHDEPSVTKFEGAFGKGSDRDAYNHHHFAEARRRGRPVRGEHAGFSDLFVPLIANGSVEGILATGPFVRKAPTSADILESWYRLTGRQGHPADAEFAAYLAGVLSMLVLEGDNLERFEEALGCLAMLMMAKGDPGELMARAEALHFELGKIRDVERTWEDCRDMIDERFSRIWESAAQEARTRGLGLPRIPNEALVGLTVSGAADVDPVDEAIRRDAFQRECVALTRALGSVVAGKVGDHGVVLLSAWNSTPARSKQKVLELSEKISSVARKRFGLTLRFGSSLGLESSALSRKYQAALAAAETACTRDVRIVFADVDGKRPTSSLRHLRDQLGRVSEGNPAVIQARFERYAEMVAIRTGYRVDLARTHLEVGFERMASALLEDGVVDPKSLETQMLAVDQASADARTMSELLAAYRRVLTDLTNALQNPVAASHDRGLRGALQYIHEHYAEPLSLRTVAKAAGFATNYFSKLFHEREGTTFREYLGKMRLERAKQLLSETGLGVARVARLAGFSSPEYMARVFRREERVTPLGYRRRAAKKRPK